MVRILNVAEKNDAAKNVAEILSRGRFTRREGFSVYNKIYEFDMELHGERCNMIMTSVTGHLLNQAFTGHYRMWTACNPLDLFEAPMMKICEERMQPIKRTLEREIRSVNRLIIWTDCDREGENIGFEIINVCKAVKPNVQIFRAKFSEITFQSVNRALQTLGPPDEKQNAAVEVRCELDLRIGAAFTRFQTLRLQKVFPQALAETLISYGSCQFPTLGFVVERYKAIEQFIPEGFWKIKVAHETDTCVVEFLWRRVRLFNEIACQVLLDKCLERPTATVKSVKTKPKSKWRPLPLDTVELEKLGSRKLRINAKEIMSVSEKLYTSGYISYPRTETNIFPKELNLLPLVQMQTQSQDWGDFASRIVNDGPTPRQGRKSDQAHPPIHPTKFAHNLNGNEKIVYEFVVRHFLACLSKDAKGSETVVEIDVNEEKLSAAGLIILERNYLEVYPYDRWSDKEMPHYEEGQTFNPSAIEMNNGQTSPPHLLTEADLISLMEKHGIGTDATHAEHIETIKARLYVGVQDSRFVPGELGMGLVEGYDSMGFEMSKPFLRSNLEADLKRICEGTKDPKVVLAEQVQSYKSVFEQALRQAAKIDEALAKFLNEAPLEVQSAVPDVPQVSSVVTKCPNCNCDVILKSKKDKKGFFLSCTGFPTCKVCLWFPEYVQNVIMLDQICHTCSHHPKKLKFQFTPRIYFPYLPNEYISCVGGCDQTLLETLGIQVFPPKRREPQSSLDSGYMSGSSSQMIDSRVSRTPLVTLDNRSGTRINAAPNSVPPRIMPRPASGDSGFSSGVSVPRSTSQFRPTREARGDTGDAIICNCNEDAILLTVRKEGSNKGRQFYKCAKPTGQGCSFFLWADENTEENSGGGHRPDDDSGGGPGNSFGNSFGSGNSRGGTRPFTSGAEFVRPAASYSNSNRNDSTLDRFSTNGFTTADDTEFNEGAIPNCNCGIPAKKCTVFKDGPNKGKPFYGCVKYVPERCSFFQWGDDTSNNSSTQVFIPSQRPSTSSHSFNTSTSFNNPIDPNSNSGDNFTGANLMCNCGIPARRLTVNKEGANTGRQFYTCDKNRSEQCGFFQWADDDATSAAAPSQAASSSYTNWNQGYGNGGTGTRGGMKRKFTNYQPKRRKCGICGVEGHNRKSCPHA